MTRSARISPVSLHYNRQVTMEQHNPYTHTVPVQYRQYTAPFLYSAPSPWWVWERDPTGLCSFPALQYISWTGSKVQKVEDKVLTNLDEPLTNIYICVDLNSTLTQLQLPWPSEVILKTCWQPNFASRQHILGFENFQIFCSRIGYFLLSEYLDKTQFEIECRYGRHSVTKKF